MNTKLTEITACKQCPKMVRGMFQKPSCSHWDIVKMDHRMKDIPNEDYGCIPEWCPLIETPWPR